MENYYAIQVVTGQEQRIKEIFTKSYSNHVLSEQIDLLIPQQLVYTKTRHRDKRVWRPQCPGYIIIKCSNLTNEIYYMLKRLRGVIRVLESSIPVEQMQSFFGSGYSRYQKRLEITKKLLQRNNSFSNIFSEFKDLIVVGCSFRYKWKRLIRNRSAPLLN